MSKINVNVYLVSIRWRRQATFLQRLASAELPDDWTIEFRHVPCADASKLPSLPGTPYSDWVVDDAPKSLQQWWGKEVTRGEVGCLLSHLSAINVVAKSTADLNIVFEDDANVDSNLFFQLSKSMSDLPDDWDCLYLGRNKVYAATEEQTFGSLVRPSFSYQGHAITWTAKAASKMIENIDSFMENQIPYDELLPVIFGVHPRKDLNQLFSLRLNAYATIEKLSRQVDDSIHDTV